MTRKSRNPKTKKGGRTITATKAPAKRNSPAKNTKSKAPVGKTGTTKKPVAKRAAAKVAIAKTTQKKIEPCAQTCDDT